MKEELKNGIKTFHASSTEAWRSWLQENHDKEQSVWVILYKKHSDVPSITWNEAVDEAICFGWIDSTRNKRDENSFYQFFAQRKPKSDWSKVNKAKVATLLKNGKMAEAGLNAIATAKANGSWTALDDVEKLIVPDDLQKMFDEHPIAYEHWEKFPISSKKLILWWVTSAKRPETRTKRIQETVRLAVDNLRANHYRQ